MRGAALKQPIRAVQIPTASGHNIVQKGGEKVSYEANAYNWLKRLGLDKKYAYPGIYSISIDDRLVYIGKSENMLVRVAQHYVGIRTGSERKYRLLAEAQRQGRCIKFDVVYYAKEHGCHAVKEEIGQKEGEYIRKYLPPLNYQIPREENWHSYEVNESAKTITLAEILRQDP